ncbi:response regulator transcription factor [Hymenobacter busanensis]|uniref:Response regulator transcription factor n=1 Tax=Hymenobacter busanensis TaxID=2607656 RepID=A0A7L4ZUL5_9BACT|nr:response regulator transcription factor [Hymenobacter busanensis]KAA9339078.1 response regulator transcription factor [Hymenobacter busanensis]QHJ07159.1 response regulator [Hymenobacter busanensis]
MSEPVPGTIHVVLVDDRPMIVEGIKSLLQGVPDIQVVAQFATAAEALRRFPKLADVQAAIVDLNMAGTGGSGVDLIRNLHQKAPAIRLLALSVMHDHHTVAEVLEAGGAGFLLKNTSRAGLIEAIREVAEGHTYFSHEVGVTLLQNMRFPLSGTDNRENGTVELTSREREILQLIAQEYSNSHIAEALFISERTVESHRKNILTKTNSKSVVGLIQYALRHKLIS